MSYLIRGLSEITMVIIFNLQITDLVKLRGSCTLVQ